MLEGNISRVSLDGVGEIVSENQFDKKGEKNIFK